MEKTNNDLDRDEEQMNEGEDTFHALCEKVLNYLPFFTRAFWATQLRFPHFVISRIKIELLITNSR